MKTVLIALVLVGLCIVGMAISMIIKRNGRFPEIHIGRNKDMKDKGISCATSQDKEQRKVDNKLLNDEFNKL
ncbi:MAG: hypothetical protein N4A49_14750 [Marinifilaceae bacterium]|jgi:hypothetical protein|nr:hypothetical protein [Marinifilaceae bacterium]